MNEHMNRRTFLRRAGLGSAAAASLPALFAGAPALAGESNGQRVFAFVSFSQPAAPVDGVLPRIGMQGCGTFKPDIYIRGGGTFVMFDAASVSVPKPLIASGAWRPTEFVGYDKKGLESYGNIQPGILTMTADLDDVATGATLTLVCNVGAANLLTGEEEGWTLEADTIQFGSLEFEPLSPIVGTTHLSVEGISVPRG